MSWANYHTHCSFCDGTEDPEAYILEAISSHVASVGFSSHCPLPVITSWNMPEERFDEYFDTLGNLKKKYEGKADVNIGLEVDYISGVDVLAGRDISRLGYTIGSVHFLGRDGLKNNWTVDGSAAEFERGVGLCFGGDMRKAVEAYYMSLQEMIIHTDADIIGHFDIIKKNNEHGRYFDENEAWYASLTDATLDLVSGYGKIVEINNGGMSRGIISSMYPSVRIMEKCLDKKIPVVMSSDAHTPGHLIYGFREMSMLLDAVGFKEVFVLKGGKWGPRGFSPEGIHLNLI